MEQFLKKSMEDFSKDKIKQNFWGFLKESLEFFLYIFFFCYELLEVFLKESLEKFLKKNFWGLSQQIPGWFSKRTPALERLKKEDFF